jgi:hypothetical protein
MRVVLEALCGPVGLDARDARLIKMTNNAVFHLPSEAVVVRIATTSTLFHRVAKVVAVANWLAGTEIAQPLQAAGTLATVWRHIQPTAPDPGPRDLARVIGRWHRHGEPPLGLPVWDPVADARLRLSDAEGLDESDHAYLLECYDELEAGLSTVDPVLPVGVIHGDAHTGNLIRAPDGAVIIADFDNTCIGPREWDLVPVACGASRFGAPERHRAFVDVYGHDVTRSPNWPVLRATRELQMVTSVVPVLTSNPAIAAQFRHRLQSIRNGDDNARWQPYI